MYFAFSKEEENEDSRLGIFKEILGDERSDKIKNSFDIKPFSAEKKGMSLVQILLYQENLLMQLFH